MEIKVISDQEQRLRLELLTEEEQETLFEQYAKDNPEVSQSTVDSIHRMMIQDIDLANRYERPDLRELLLRKVIYLSCKHGGGNTAVIPVIGDHSSGIRVRFDTRVLVTDDGRDRIIPPGDEISVIGVVINPVGAPPHTLTHARKFRPLTSERLRSLVVGPRLPMGSYSIPEATLATDGYFISPDYTLVIAATQYTQPALVLFEDLDEMKLMRVLNSLFDYLAGLEKYADSGGAEILARTQINEVLTSHGYTEKMREFEAWLPLTPSHNESPSQDHDPILVEFESKHHGAFDQTYHGGIIADIYARGFASAYYAARQRGLGDSVVKTELARHAERQARAAFALKIREKAAIVRDRVNAYKIIIGRKFGPKRLAQVEKEIATNPRVIIEADGILGLLKPAERKPVVSEYQRRVKYLEAVLNNTCPHVRLYRRFRSAHEDAQVKKLYAELKRYYGEAPSMIQCNKCGYDLICPHLRDYTEADLAGKNQSEIKARLTKYIGDTRVQDQYYCKICGEVISSLEVFDDAGETRDPASMMNEELKNFMWGEIAGLMKYLKFESIINVQQLITLIRDACYDYIFEIEKQILKSKTNSADEIKAKKRLYVTIYAFAYIIHLVLSNSGSIVSFRGLKIRDRSKAIVDTIKHVLGVISLSRNIIIREIPGMSPDLIKNKLIEAYKLVSAKGTQTISYSGETEELLTTLLLDPVYYYLYHMYMTATGKTARSRFDAVDRIDAVLGIPLAKLEKEHTGVFSHVNIPPVKGKGLNHEYYTESFNLFMRKLTQKLYAETMYVDITADSGSKDVLDVKLSEPFEEQTAKWQIVRELEERVYREREIASAKVYKEVPGVETRRWSRPQVHLGRIYDEDGLPHAWKIYAISADGKTTDARAGDIAKSTETGTVFAGVVSDRKCADCGIAYSRTDTLDEKKIRESLAARNAVGNFFRFYENRCPRGGLHEFAEDTCSKCGLGLNYGLAPTSRDSMNYYREYKAIHTRERDEFNAGDPIEIFTPKPPQDVHEYATEYENWAFNFNVILDLANKLKVNQRLLTALGATEKIDYAEVLSGAYIPPEAEDRTDTRIYMISSHIKNLITEYNQLRYFHRLVKPPANLLQLVDASGISRHRIAELGEKMPDIYKDYNRVFAYVQRTKKPRDIVQFVLQRFCEMCLCIYDDNTKETEKLRHSFVAYFVGNVLRSGELVSKPGYFSWSLLFGTKERESSDTNYSINDEPEAVPDDESTAPMSMDDFDVETEGQDPDDDDNDWKVGEDLGL